VLPLDIPELDYSQDTIYFEGLVMDPDLVTIFRSLRHITILFNKCSYNKTPMDGKTVQKCMAFIHSGLLKLEGQLEDTLSECLRLGMMAFLATTFRVPGLKVQNDCASFGDKLRKSYAVTKATNIYLHKTVDIWLIIICLILTSEKDEHGLYEFWESIAAHRISWDDTRKCLKAFLWIDSFHDDLGRNAFTMLNRVNHRTV
jgi:hypothetical protein